VIKNRRKHVALHAHAHWQGGDHTTLRVAKNHVGQHRWSTEADVVELVSVLARQMPDQAIAAVLNRAGKTTGRGNGWTRSRVCNCAIIEASRHTATASGANVAR